MVPWFLVIALVVLAFGAGVAWARLHDQPKRPHMVGGFLMFVVPATTPDTRYKITPPTSVTDAEGNVVPATELVYAVSSDNPSAVELTPDAPDALEGGVHFGAPNADGSPALANVNVTVSSKGGTLLGSFGAQFTVPAGDAAAIVGGGISFDGLTES